MSKLITSEKARLLSGPTIEEHLETLSGHIEAAAKMGKREVVVRHSNYAGWLYSPKEMTADQKAVISKLEEAGYKVSLFYEERQFVDMGLRINWEGGSE